MFIYSLRNKYMLECYDVMYVMYVMFLGAEYIVNKKRLMTIDVQRKGLRVMSFLTCNHR